MWRSILICIGSLLLVFNLNSQKHDYVWHLGYDFSDNPKDSLHGKSIIDFNDSLSKPTIYYCGDSQIDYYGVNATISDEAGNYLFTYNGTYIEDASNNVMMNGSMLSESGDEFGDFPHQSGLILPLPESEHKYVLFHSSWKYFDLEIGLAGNKLHYSVIDMELNNGKGAVTSRRNLILHDTFDLGKITSTRHANGRDWWIIIPSYNDDKFYRVLLTPNGPELLPSQNTGIIHLQGLGHSCFSPDGNFYSHYSSINKELGSFLYVYSFDRQTGLLGNPRKLQLHLESGRQGSISISPNSSILYLFTLGQIFQFDLKADSILNTKSLVAEVDDYLHPIPGNNDRLPHNFYMSQLGPDGKIYVCPYNGNSVFTTVEYPDRWGESCFVNQHSVHLPTFNTSVPNFPNYRLGPMDGSDSDTLGINNLPLARFRIDQDTSDHLKFQFIDLSNYNPNDWYWTFGNGSESAEMDPVHSFSEPGIYKICLEVSNENGIHRTCKEIIVGATSATIAQFRQHIIMYPNPAKDQIQLPVNNLPYSILNTQGKVIQNGRVEGQMIPIDRLPTGLYIMQVRDDQKIYQGKFVKE